MGGLEPPRITPHAPQTCTSTIPPHRHGANIQISVFCYVVDVPDVDSRSTLSENDTQSFSCGRVPHRQKYIIFNFQNLLSLSMCRMLTQGQPSRKTTFSCFPAAECHIDKCNNIQFSKFVVVVDAPDVLSRRTLSENDTQSFSCGRVPHRLIIEF